MMIQRLFFSRRPLKFFGSNGGDKSHFERRRVRIGKNQNKNILKIDPPLERARVFNDVPDLYHRILFASR